MKPDRCFRIILLGALLLVSACNTQPQKKIAFDISLLDEQGLIGPDDGKRALDYEYCIPARQYAAALVYSIDPTTRLYPATTGRVECDRQSWVAMGNTHQHDAREVLLRLAGLRFVERIEPAWFE